MIPAYSIHQLPEEERPRERLLRHGAESISSTELIAILLGTGMKGKPVLQLAHELLAHFGGLRALGEATLEELCVVKGLGQAKAIQLKAAFSLGMRLSQEGRASRYKVENPTHAYNLVKDEMAGENREFFMGIFLDTKGYLICREVIAIGSLAEAKVHPREVFYPAIRHKAASFIIAHNHPSGDPTPSQQDIEMTAKLVETGRVVGIPISDHIVVGEGKFVSLRQRGVPF